MGIAIWLLVTSLAQAQGVWERRAPYPVRATEVSGAAVNGRIYVVCGILPDNSNDTGLHIYDPVRDEWAEGPAIPISGGADHCNVASAGGKLYLLGAIRISQAFVSGETYEYDPESRTWSAVGRMGVPRGASGVAVIGTKIYVAGGLAGGRSSEVLEVFDTQTRQWTRLANMPTARDHLTAQAVGGRLYAIGGRDNSRDVPANEEYDPVANSWRTRLPMPTARGGIASGNLRGRIQVLGGEGNSGRPENTFTQNEEYDPGSDTWGILSQLANPRHGFYGVTFEGRIFTPGGGPVAGFSFSDVNDAFFLPLPNAPAVAARGVRNSASQREEAAPGTILSLTGENLSQGVQLATRFPLPAQMNQTTVRVNGATVPVLFVAPGLINFQLPYTLVPGPLNITVTHVGQTSAIYPAPDAFPTAPGIYTQSGTGEGQATVFLAGTGSIADATRPARRGELIEIFCTGLGRLDFPPRGLGEAAAFNQVSKTVESPEVTIGGAVAEVSYSGLAPGWVGLYRIDARVPASAVTGAAVPLVIRIGGRQSNTTTIAVTD